MDDILSERRFHWLGHVKRMDHQRRRSTWRFQRDEGRTNWRSTVNKDLLRMWITWEEAEVAARNRSEWRRSVAQCIHLDAGWIEVYVKRLGLDSSLAQSFKTRIKTQRFKTKTEAETQDIVQLMD